MITFHSIYSCNGDGCIYPCMTRNWNHGIFYFHVSHLAKWICFRPDPPSNVRKTVFECFETVQQGQMAIATRKLLHSRFYENFCERFFFFFFCKFKNLNKGLNRIVLLITFYFQK